MDSLKATNELEKKIHRIMEAREKDISDLEDKIIADEKAIETAEEDMNIATNAGNLEAYREAKARRAFSIDSKEMHQSKLTALRDKPLISLEEYREGVSSVRHEIEKLERETKEVLKALSDKMDSEAERLSDALIRANGILESWQHDIFRDADRSRNPKTGEPLPISSERAQVNAEYFFTVKWGKMGVNSVQYKMFTGQKV